MPRPFFLKRILPIIIFLIGSLVTLLLAREMAVHNKEDALATVINYSERHSSRIKSQIEQDVFFLGALANLVDASTSEQLPRFDILSKHIMSGTSAMVSIQWSPKINTDELHSHVQKMQNNYPSFRSFAFREGAEKRYATLLSRKLPLYMVSQVYPTTPANLSVLGYYSVSKRFENTLLKMKATQEPFLSDRVFLLQDNYNKNVTMSQQKIKQNGLLMYYPVFNAANTGLLGYFISAIQIDRFFEKYIKLDNVDTRGYAIKVFDHGPASSDDPVLYQSNQWDPSFSKNSVSQQIDIYGRPWEIHYQKVDEQVFSYTSNAMVTLFGGFFISLLVSFIVRVSLQSKEKLRFELANRTKELRYQVEHDTLTELYNRYAFGKKLHLLNQQHAEFSLIAIDIDKFKQINDSFGHCAGDDALKFVATSVSSILAPNDMFARMGGDEFCIVTMATEKVTLERLCRDICVAINHQPIKFKDQYIAITASVGAKKSTTTNIDELYHQVDLLLYETKAAGRNGFSVAS